MLGFDCRCHNPWMLGSWFSLSHGCAQQQVPCTLFRPNQAQCVLVERVGNAAHDGTNERRPSLDNCQYPVSRSGALRGASAAVGASVGGTWKPSLGGSAAAFGRDPPGNNLGWVRFDDNPWSATTSDRNRRSGDLSAQTPPCSATQTTQQRLPEPGREHAPSLAVLLWLACPAF